MTNPIPSAFLPDAAGAIDPEDAPFVELAESVADAGGTEEQIFEAVQGYAVDPKLPAAITAGDSVAVTGVNANQTVSTGTPQAIVAGSTQAEGIVSAYSLPLVGAGEPTVQSLQQLAQRFDGLSTGVADPQFPTLQ